MRVGTLVWAVALVVTVVLAATGSLTWDAAWVCGVGIVLGLLGMRWAYRHPPQPDPAADHAGGPADHAGAAADEIVDPRAE